MGGVDLEKDLLGFNSISNSVEVKLKRSVKIEAVNGLSLSCEYELRFLTF